MDEKRDDLTKKGFEDSLKGKADQLKGKIKDAAGELRGDDDLQREGKIDQFKGKVKDTIGKVERKIDDASKSFKDSDPDRSSDDDL